MNSKNNVLRDSVIATSIGVALSIGVVELYSNILPASDYIPYQRPVVCFENEINLKCLRRRSMSGKYTKGGIVPAEIQANKRINDIFQFSDINFSKFLSSNKKKLLSVGDSYVEALQVSNEETFHHKLNEQSVNKSYDSYISTAIGASGMSFPNYIKSVEYAQRHLSPKEYTLIIPIISNDFQDAFNKRGSDKFGSFYFNSDGSFKFIPLTSGQSITARLLSYSKILRFLLLNLEIQNLFSNSKATLSEASSNSISINDGKKATDIFLEHLNQLRPSPFDKKNTIFVIDSDRPYIYGARNYADKSFQSNKKYFVSAAKRLGYSIIDTKPTFKEYFFKYGKKVEFTIDPHWNKVGHDLVYKLIRQKLSLLEN